MFSFLYIMVCLESVCERMCVLTVPFMSGLLAAWLLCEASHARI